MWPWAFLIGTAVAVIFLLADDGPQLSGRANGASGPSRSKRLPTVKANPKLPPKPPKSMSKRAWTRGDGGRYDLEVEEED